MDSATAPSPVWNQATDAVGEVPPPTAELFAEIKVGAGQARVEMDQVILAVRGGHGPGVPGYLHINRLIAASALGEENVRDVVTEALHEKSCCTGRSIPRLRGAIGGASPDLWVYPRYNRGRGSAETSLLGSTFEGRKGSTGGANYAADTHEPHGKPTRTG